MRLFMLIFCGLFMANVNANIYKCVKNDGLVIFKDTPCAVRDIQPAVVLKEQNLDQQDIKHLQRQYNQQQDFLRREKNRIYREQYKAKQQQKIEEKQRLRLQAKCETVKHQIAQLERRYKQGYTVKQGQALDRKLAECKLNRQKYCKK